MHRAICRAAVLTVALGLAAQPGLARAQTNPPVTPSPAAKAAGVPPAQTPQGQRDVNRAEARINQLYKQLKITEAEKAQWDAFAGVMRQNAQHMDQVFADHGNPMTGSALDDMKAYEMITQAHAEDVGKLEPAFEALYNAMSPDQKHTADDVFHQYARQQAQNGTRG